MKKRKLKLCLSLFAVVFLFSALAAVSTAYAYFDNNRDYTFKISAQQGVKQWEQREYRNTKNNKNAWKVQLRVSGEGEHTVTQFCLALQDKTCASNWYGVKQGDGAKYSPSNDAGKHVYVYLQGRNNNKNASTYTVTGVWDEETGKILS